MRDDTKREKNWKLLYTRSVKLARAKQLGFEYPVAKSPEHEAHSLADEADRPINILFICSRNQWRSPTAEKIWRNHDRVSVRSAGTSPNARRPVSVSDLQWADAIFVMEEKHKSRLVAEYRRVIVRALEDPDHRAGLA